MDISLVECFQNIVSVTAISGNNQLGGRDFDNVIARSFCHDCHLDFDRLSSQQQAILLRQAEFCKIALTAKEQVTMVVETEELSASLPISNEWLIEKSRPLFQKMITPIRQVLLDASVSAQELDNLILAGGSSHMPVVKRCITQFLDKEPVPDSEPDTAIVSGVAVCAAMKAKDPEIKELIVTDICPFTLGISTFNSLEPEHPLMSPIIERNSALPTSKTGTYYTIRDDQTKLEFEICQGEHRYCKDNLVLGNMSLTVPPAPKGHESIQVRFTYDINGLLEVESVNQLGQSKSLVIKNNTISEQDVQKRLKELASLKLHPRDAEENRALLARGERLYTETTGTLRERISAVMDWYQRQLNTQETLKVAKANKYVSDFFDQIEASMEDTGIPSPHWFFPEDQAWEDE